MVILVAGVAQQSLERLSATLSLTDNRGEPLLHPSVFEAVDGGELPETAWSILSARLLTAAATEINAAIDGVDLRSPIDWGRFSEDIFLPFVTR